MRTPRSALRCLGTVTLLALSARSIQAQPVADHLKCYKVKDSASRAKYTADLGGLVAEPGCSIQVPGRLLCTDATKTNITPEPPGGPDTAGPAGRFLCYKVKCPRAVPPPIQWHDQFGSRSLTLGTASLLCAPEILSTTTTSTTTTPPTTAPGGTTTTRCPSTTTTAWIPCTQQDPAQCSSGTCTGGQPCGVAGPGQCGCIGPPAPCGDTSPLCGGDCPSGTQCFPTNPVPPSCSGGCECR